MRLTPVALAFAPDIDAAVEASGRSSMTTHPARRPVDACRYLGALIAAAVSGASKWGLLDERVWRWGELDPEIEDVVCGSFKRAEPPGIQGGGYVVSSLEAALWTLHRSDLVPRRRAAGGQPRRRRRHHRRRVRSGRRCDIRESGMAAEWLQRLTMRDLIGELAERLCKMRPSRGEEDWT